MKKIAALLLLLMALPVALQAQAVTTTQREAMKKLDYMVGQWRGTGWIEQGGPRRAFAGTEIVQSKLGGLALLVEGNFKGKVAGQNVEVTVHETLAVISYDDKARLHRFRTYLANGATGDHEFKLMEGGWQWGIQYPGANIRFIMKLNEKGQWYEIGEISRDDKTWQKFFEMTLQRVK